MKQVQVNFPQELLHHLRMQEVEFSNEIKKIALLKLYELGKISSGKAASLLGTSKVGFLELLNQYEISVFNDEEEEYLGKDVENALSVGKYKNKRTHTVPSSIKIQDKK